MGRFHQEHIVSTSAKQAEIKPHPNHHQTMVIKMTDSSNKKTTSSNQQNQSQLRRTKMRPSQNYSLQNGTNKNTKAEFKRLKTILPSIKRKENVSKLDIILEAIKYIDDLQDQLFDRLSGTHSQREATLLALTEQDMERSRARLNQLRQSRSTNSNSESSSDDEATIEEDFKIGSDQDDNNSHDSLEL